MLMQTGTLVREAHGLFDCQHVIMSLQGNGAGVVRDLSNACKAPTISVRANALASTSGNAMASHPAKAGMSFHHN